MSGELIPPAIPEGSGSQAPPKEQTSYKGADHQHDDLGPPDGNKGGKSKTIIISAIVFAALESLGVYFWQISEGLLGISLIVLHWMSLSCLVAGPFAVWHQMVEGGDVFMKRMKIWAWYALASVLSFIVAAVVWYPHAAPAKPEIQKAVPAEVIENPDFIEGTVYTHQQISEAFPYGWEIIHLGADGGSESREFSSNPLPWQIDWKKVTIQPNFATGRVLVTVPSASFKSGGIEINGTEIQYDIALKKGLVNFTTVYESNKPCLYLIILSVNPRHSVFAFGYGIWDESHPGLPGFTRQ